MNLWSERVMVAFPKTHALAHRDFVYWTDLKNERFVMSQCDPGPEIQSILLNKLSSPGNIPLIKQIKAHHSLMMSAVEGEYGVTLTCESSSSNPLPDIVFREVRDGNGPTRLGFVAYWQRNNDNPALKQFLARLQAHPAVPTTIGGTLPL
jgi:DNA-binding transcriptional LysR family regulator